MKLRTLARVALRNIKNNTFIFDSQRRRVEAYKVLYNIIKGKQKNIPLIDPIIEFHIGVYIPSFDYPIVPVDGNNEPVIWEEDNNYAIPGTGSHRFLGIGLSGEKYCLSFVESLSDFRDLQVKVDKYTSEKRAAYALVCVLTKVIDKLADTPIKLDHDATIEEWDKHDDIKQYEKEQHKLYIKWLSGWIAKHGRNPDTHVKALKVDKKDNS